MPDLRSRPRLLALRRARLDRLLLRVFGWTTTVMDWAFFGLGLAGAAGTAAGWLPPFGGSTWSKVTTVIVWVIVARQGYDSLVDAAEDELDGAAGDDEA